MGILASKQPKVVTGATKRRSTQLDFSNLAPLKPGGTVGFSTFRDTDPSSKRNKARKASNGDAGAMEEDSEEDEEDTEIVGKMEDVDDKDVKTLLSPEDAKFQGELADGVGRIKVSYVVAIVLVPILTSNSAQTPTFCRACERQLPQIASIHRYYISRRNPSSRYGNWLSTQCHTVKQRVWIREFA